MQTSEYFTPIELKLQEMKTNTNNLSSKDIRELQLLEIKKENLELNLEQFLTNLDQLFKDL